ncbi:unnamed protein product [Blepharisma stoltei]|uniref:Protein kinase domain-containing protein n=1 Tax=Blepharisma stoltei TaxID=1481888 RepID=A0AAU9K5Q7_9CILI|nr:unnamed protein product [Blepharisma stoltei]
MGCGKPAKTVDSIRASASLENEITKNPIPEKKKNKNAVSSEDTKFGTVTSDYEKFQVIENYQDYQILKARHISSDQSRLIKMIPKEKLTEKFLFKNTSKELRESKILNMLSHPNIQKCLGVIEDNTRVGIVYEYLKDMESLQSQNKIYSELETSYIMRQLFSSVAYIHAKKVVHRNINLKNIYINSDNLSVKLCNFEDAYIKGQEPPLEFSGELPFIAPDFKSSGYHEKSDEWNCGVVMYMLLTGESPFKDKNEEEIKEIKDIASYLKELEKYSTLSLQARYIIEQLLSTNLLTRISAEAVKNYPWMQKGYRRSKTKRKTNTQKELSITNSSLSKETDSPGRHLSYYPENKSPDDSKYLDMNELHDEFIEDYNMFLKNWVKRLKYKEGKIPNSYQDFCEKEMKKYGEFILDIQEDSEA